MLCVKFCQNWQCMVLERKPFHILSMFFFAVSLLIPFWRGRTLLLNKHEFSLPKDAFCQEYLKLDLWFWRRRFYSISSMFRCFVIISPWKKCESLNPLYPRELCAKINWNCAGGFGEEGEFVKTLYTEGRTDDGKQAIRKSHMIFQLRWAKNWTFITSESRKQSAWNRGSSRRSGHCHYPENCHLHKNRELSPPARKWIDHVIFFFRGEDEGGIRVLSWGQFHKTLLWLRSTFVLRSMLAVSKNLYLMKTIRLFKI